MIKKDLLIKKMENGFACRYMMYLDVYDQLENILKDADISKMEIAEFGGSYGAIRTMIQCPNFTVSNLPTHDVQDLINVSSNKYDMVILDQILEHVKDPYRAVKEMYRVLKPGGWFVNTCPFLIWVHPAPSDYWRFTKSAMRFLLEEIGGFVNITTKSWGNTDVITFEIKNKRWYTVAQLKEMKIWSERNDPNFEHMVWSFAQKRMGDT